jgi:hypothetical protein
VSLENNTNENFLILAKNFSWKRSALQMKRELVLSEVQIRRVVRNKREKEAIHQQKLDEEIRRYENVTREEAAIHQRNLEKERARHENIMTADPLNILVSFEVECFDGKASSRCAVDEIDGDIVHCVARDTPAFHGLTYETIDVVSESQLAARLESKTMNQLVPSTSFPSLRAGIGYRGFDRVQVASYNGDLWWNATVIAPVHGRPEIIVQLDQTLNRPMRVKLSSVRLKDWFKLHKNCRRAIYQVYLFLRRALVPDMAKVLSKMLWDMRDDREWDF